jgi:hypothetical protein
MTISYLTPPGGGAGGADPNAIHVNVANEISGIAAKAAPVAADIVVIEDSAAAWAKKKVVLDGADVTAIHDNVAAEINAVAAKAVPIAADLLLIEDSAAANAKKKITIGTLPEPTYNCHMMTGTYVGDGVDNRNINIGINLTAMTYKYVIIKSAANRGAMHRIEYGQGDIAMGFNNITDLANSIQAFTATGFQVGTDVTVNNSGETYRYIAFWVD